MDRLPYEPVSYRWGTGTTWYSGDPSRWRWGPDARSDLYVRLAHMEQLIIVKPKPHSTRSPG